MPMDSSDVNAASVSSLMKTFAKLTPSGVMDLKPAGTRKERHVGQV